MVQAAEEELAAAKAAVTELQAKLAEKGSKKNDNQNFAFEVNNNTVYTQVAQFKRVNRPLVQEYLKCRQQYQSLETTLADLRVLYEHANAGKRQQMEPILLAKEREYETLETKLEQLAKTIRNNENSGL